MDFKKLLFFKEPETKSDFVLENRQSYPKSTNDGFKISSKINVNEEYVKKRLNYPKNNDIIIKS